MRFYIRNPAENSGQGPFSLNELHDLVEGDPARGKWLATPESGSPTSETGVSDITHWRLIEDVLREEAEASFPAVNTTGCWIGCLLFVLVIVVAGWFTVRFLLHRLYEALNELH